MFTPGAVGDGRDRGGRRRQGPRPGNCAGAGRSFVVSCRAVHHVSATGGWSVGPAPHAAPALGNLAGVGSGGDLNLYGGDGRRGCESERLCCYLGGYGGDGPLSGGIMNSGTTGNAGRFPGGGASGAGSGSSGTTPYTARRARPAWLS